jgi:tetratricopeptide (TPR) repeat protein
LQLQTELALGPNRAVIHPRKERLIVRNRNLSCVRVAAVVLATALVVSLVPRTLAGTPGEPPSQRTPEVEQAWTALWSNDARAARRGFGAALKADDKNLDARRGMILCDLQLGYDREVIDHLERLSKTEGAGIRDFLLVEYCYKYVGTHGKDEKTMVKICKELAKQKTLDPLDRRPMLSALIGYGIGAGDRGAVEDAARKLNRVDQWMILGPFSNISGGGHNKDFLEYPEKEFSRTYTGRAGLEITWFQPRRLSLASNINFYNHVGHDAYTTCYAGFELTVEEPRDLVVSVSQTGALKVFVNHETVLDFDRDRSQGEINHLAVNFAPGTHTLIFKCSVRSGSPDIAVSVSEPDGRRPKDVEIKPLSSFGPESPPTTTVKTLTIPGFKQLEDDYGRNPGDPEATFWYLLALLLFMDEEKVRVVANDAFDRFADNATILHVAAVSALVSEDMDAWRGRMKSLYDIMPENRFGLLFEAQTLAEQHAYTRADSLLVAAVKRNPEFVTARLALMLSLQARDRISRAVELAEEIREQYPEYPEPYQILSAHAEAMGDRSRAKRLRNDAFRRQTRSEEAFERWRAAADREDYGEMADQMEELHKIFPDSYTIQIYLAVAKIYDGDAQKGIDLTMDLAADFPNVAGVQRFKAEIEDLRWPDPSNKGLVISCYKRVVELDPSDFDARDRLRELTGKTPVREILPPIDLVSLRDSRVDAADYPDADAVVILDESRRICLKDGYSYSDYALVIKILTDEGAQMFSTVETGINPYYSDYIVKAMRTVKPDGQEIEAEMLLGRVAFKSLSAGDIIELHYGSSSWSAGDLNRQFWDSHMFKWQVPMLASRFILLVQWGAKFEWRLNNYSGDSSNVVTPVVLKEFKKYEWEMRSVEAVHDEPLLPPWRDGVPWLDISSVKSWQEINDWYYKLSDVPSRRDPVVAEKVDEVIAGVSGTDAQIRTLYDFVCNEVKYEDLLFQYSAFVPEEARRVLQAMYGDCKDKACLLRSMLAEIDVESYFVLVTPLSFGGTPYLPSPRFNHVVLAIPRGNGYWFVDPTAEWMPPAEIPWSLKGAQGLLIRPGEPELVKLESASQSGVLAGAAMADADSVSPGSAAPVHTGCVRTKISMVGEDDIRVTRHECVHDGNRIARVRSSLAGQSADEQAKLINQVLNLQVTGASIEDCRWQGLDSASDSIVCDYSFLVKGGVTRQGDLKVLRIPWDSRLGRVFGVMVADEEREEPLYTYNLRLDETEHTTLAIPEGWRLLSLPESKYLSNSYGAYDFKYENRGSDLVANRRLAINRATVPAAEYSTFKQLIDGALKEQEAVVILQRE